MDTQRLTSIYFDLTRGWHGFLLLYLAVAVFSPAGLKRGHARAALKSNARPRRRGL